MGKALILGIGGAAALAAAAAAGASAAPKAPRAPQAPAASAEAEGERLGRTIEAAIKEGGPFFTAEERAVIERKCGYAPGSWDGFEASISDGAFRCSNGRRVDDPEMRALLAAAEPRIAARIEAAMERADVAGAVERIAEAATREALAAIDQAMIAREAAREAEAAARKAAGEVRREMEEARRARRRGAASAGRD